MLVLSKYNCAVTFETNEVPIYLSHSSTTGVPRHTPALFFSPFFRRKQKINVSKSGLCKPNLKLMWVSISEGQTQKQRSILEAWAGLVTLLVTQRAASQACQESSWDFQAEDSREAWSIQICSWLPHRRSMQYVSTPSHDSAFQQAPRPSKTSLGET